MKSKGNKAFKSIQMCMPFTFALCWANWLKSGARIVFFWSIIFFLVQQFLRIKWLIQVVVAFFEDHGSCIPEYNMYRIPDRTNSHCSCCYFFVSVDVCLCCVVCLLCVMEMFTFIFVNSATMTLFPYIITICVNVRAHTHCSRTPCDGWFHY